MRNFFAAVLRVDLIIAHTHLMCSTNELSREKKYNGLLLIPIECGSGATKRKYYAVSVDVFVVRWAITSTAD